MNYEYFRDKNKEVSGFLSVEKYFRKNFEFDYKNILEYTKEFINSPFKEKLYRYFKEDLLDKRCSCGSATKFLSIEKGYQEFCSLKCANKNTGERIKLVKQERYGDPNYNNKEKFKQSISRRSPEEITISTEKRKKTKAERYGDPNFTNKEKSRKTISNRNKINRKSKIKIYDVEITEQLEDFSYKIKCIKCNSESHLLNSRFNSRIRANQNPCLNCNPLNSGISSQEEEISNFIESLGVRVVRKDKIILEGKEIDILIPELNIGFEFNGLFWHSEFRVHKNYHLEKQEEAKRNGISLIHIWSDDWDFKKEIVKSRISHLIGKSSHRIYARKCEVKEVEFKEAKEFLEKNHIQGFCPSQKSLGLYHKGDLVSVATFGRRKISGASGNEILRFCNKNNYNIPGGFSKLLSHYIRTETPDEIITFADRSWTVSDDNFYTKNGFLKEKTSDPNYWYIVKKKRRHRFSFRKDKLIKEGFDRNKTEREIMSERGILRIYDCGQFKFKWKRKDI